MAKNKITLLVGMKYHQFELLNRKEFTIIEDANGSNNNKVPLYLNTKELKSNGIIPVFTGVGKPVYGQSLKYVNLERESDIEFMSRINNYGIDTPESFFTGRDLRTYSSLIDHDKSYLIKGCYRARSLSLN